MEDVYIHIYIWSKISWGNIAFSIFPIYASCLWWIMFSAFPNRQQWNSKYWIGLGKIIRIRNYLIWRIAIEIRLSKLPFSKVIYMSCFTDVCNWKYILQDLHGVSKYILNIIKHILIPKYFLWPSFKIAIKMIN